MGGGPFRPPFRLQKPHIGATNDKRHLLGRWKIYNFYIKHFRVRSILRSPEVISDKCLGISYLYKFWTKKQRHKIKAFCVALVKAMRNKYAMTFTGQFGNWPEVKVRSFTNEIVGCGHAAYQTTRVDQASSLVPLTTYKCLARSCHDLLTKKNGLWRHVTLDDLSRCPCQ